MAIETQRKPAIVYNREEEEMWLRWEDIKEKNKNSIASKDKPFLKIGLIASSKNELTLHRYAKQFMNEFPGELRILWNDSFSKWDLVVDNPVINNIRRKIEDYKRFKGEKVTDKQFSINKANKKINKYTKARDIVNNLFPNPVDVKDILDEVVRQ
jgi:hypothetical protein